MTSTKFYLKKHIESVHEDIRYTCSICNHQATNKENRKRHIAEVHERVERPDFRTSIHNGVKHPCSNCDYKAKTKSGLR